MRRTTLISLLAVTASLAACATARSPAAVALADGFRDQRLDDSHFRVSFTGRDAPPRGPVDRYLLYRAADLTVGEGYDWFEMVPARAADDAARSWRPAWSYERRAGFAAGAGPFIGAYDPDRIVQYEASAEILVGRGAPPSGDPRAFDARRVMTDLGRRITQPS